MYQNLQKPGKDRPEKLADLPKMLRVQHAFAGSGGMMERTGRRPEV